MAGTLTVCLLEKLGEVKGVKRQQKKHSGCQA